MIRVQLRTSCVGNSRTTFTFIAGVLIRGDRAFLRMYVFGEVIDVSMRVGYALVLSVPRRGQVIQRSRFIQRTTVIISRFLMIADLGGRLLVPGVYRIVIVTLSRGLSAFRLYGRYG